MFIGSLAFWVIILAVNASMLIYLIIGCAEEATIGNVIGIIIYLLATISSIFYVYTMSQPHAVNPFLTHHSTNTNPTKGWVDVKGGNGTLRKMCDGNRLIYSTGSVVEDAPECTSK